MNMQAAAAQDEDLDDTTTTTVTDDDDGPSPGEDRGDVFVPDGEAPAAAAAPAPAEPAEPADNNKVMIPKARFDEVNNAKKLAEEENATLKAELEAARAGKAAPAAATEPQGEQNEQQQPTLSELEHQRLDAMMEGDMDKAVEIANQINAIIRAEARRDAVAELETRSTKSAEQSAVLSVVADVVAKYPALDDSHESANTEAIDELVELRDFYIQKKGMKPSEAISAAAEKIAKIYDLGQTGEAPAVDPRTAQAIKRGAQIAATQPNTAAVGVGTRQDAGRINIAAMTEEQFDALPEAEKRRMRGD